MNKLICIMWTLLMIGVVVFVYNQPVPSIPTSKYQEGQIVCSVVSEQKGQIVKVSYFSRGNFLYNVRFEGTQTSANTNILGGNAPIKHLPLAIVSYMEEYELMECD